MVTRLSDESPTGAISIDTESGARFAIGVFSGAFLRWECDLSVQENQPGQEITIGTGGEEDDSQFLCTGYFDETVPPPGRDQLNCFCSDAPGTPQTYCAACNGDAVGRSLCEGVCSTQGGVSDSYCVADIPNCQP